MRRGVFIFWTIFIAAAGFRLWQSFSNKAPDIGPCAGHVVDGVGYVVEDPEVKDSGQVMIVNAKELFLVRAKSADKTQADTHVPNEYTGRDKGDICPSDFLVRIKTKSFPRYKYGDVVSFSGKLLSPVNFQSGNGRTFDYRGYLAKDDIYYEIKSADVRDVGGIVAGKDRSSVDRFRVGINSLLFSLKRNFIYVLNETLGEPHAALAAGLVVGGKSSLGSDLIDDFRRVGLVHIVTLSGYNITIVGDAIRRFLSFLPRVWGIGVGGVGITLFAIMVGGGATVIRSCFMAGVALSADMIRRDYSVIRALVFAGLVMLIQNPAILLDDVSFQLSFLATLGLILLARPIEERLFFVTEKFGLRGIVSATLATQIFVSPFLLYTTGQLSIIGVLANVLILPFIPITMLVVFVTGVAGMAYLPLGQLMAYLSHFLLSYELTVVRMLSSLSFSSMNFQKFSGWWVVAFYCLFAVVFTTRPLLLKLKLSWVKNH